MTMLQDVISAARTVRSEHDIDKKAEVAMAVRSDSARMRSPFAARPRRAPSQLLVKTRGAPTFEAAAARARRAPPSASCPTPHGPIEVLVGLKGLVEKDAELARIDRERKKVEKDLAALDKKLSSTPASSTARPPEVVEESQQAARDARRGSASASRRRG